MTLTPRRGLLLVLSSPSGGGKTTLARRLLAAHGDLWPSVSYTTRRARRAERAGVDYHFVDDDEFDLLVERSAFAEWCEVHGHRYGTAIAPLSDVVESGQNVVLELDTLGAEKLRSRFPAETILVYVLPPSMRVLEQRLRGRGTDSEATIARRLRRAPEELRHHASYQYRVVNDDLESAFTDLDAVLMHERALAGQVEARAGAEEVAARCAGLEASVDVIASLGI